MKKNYLVLISLLLLFSSTIVFAQRGTVTGTVTSNSESVPGATVTVKGTTTGTTTNIDGKYILFLPPGKQTLEARFIGFETVTKDVTIVSGKSVSLDFEMEQGVGLSEVVILGSRGAPRTKLETMVPVDIIGAQQIDNSSQANLSQILQYVAPSFHSTPQTISDGTDHIDPAALRGLGPDQTLVLINGKRRHTSALLNVNGTVGRGSVGTDLNAIPASAIERIEILRDGAAAQYGSDAIAGVINIVLKENTNLVSFDVQAGVTSPNAFDGPANAAGNVPDSLIPDFNSDGEMYKIGSNFGFDVGEKGGFVNVTLEYMDRASSNRSGNYTGSIYPTGYDDALSDADFFTLVQDETGFADKQVMEIGNSAVRNAGAYLNAAYPLSNDAELYGALGFNYKNGIARGFYRFPVSQDRVVPQLYPHGFSPQIHSDITDNSFIIGARGKVGEWNADMSQTRGGNEFQFNIKNSNNASLGQGSPTQAYAGGFSYSQNTSNVDFSRSFDIGVPLNVGFGGEFRLENYQIFAGEEASYVAGGVENIWPISGSTDTVSGAAGIQVFPGFQPQNALNKNRNSVGLYGDFEFDLTDEWMLGLAGRYEDYSDFGDDFNWKVATRYIIQEKVTVRASISTGFRAPSLHQIYFNNLSTQFVDDGSGNQVPIQVGTFNNESAVARAFGIEALKPEESTNFSVGLTAKLMKNWSFTADYYNIQIDDRIVISGRFSPGDTLAGGVLAGDILTPLGAGAAQFFTNAISTTTSGIDLVTTYLASVGKGSLNMTLSANFTETEVDKDGDVPKINTSDLLQGQEDILFNREEVSRIEVAQPKSKIALTSTYSLNKFTALLRLTRFGEIEYIHPSDGGDPADYATNDFTGNKETRDQVFDAKIVPDIELAYDFTNNVKWTVGIHNFTNTYPDMHQHSSNVSSGRFLFSRRVQQFGVRGMFLYTKVGFNF